jgi:hypothetical protein
MSSFIREAVNPKTGKTVKAYFIDDYYGSHLYGVGFRKDGKDASFDDFPYMDNCDFYKIEDLKK